jgi:hypothetical protein
MTMNIGKTALVAAAALAVAGAAIAQEQQRQPRGSATATVGGKKLSVDYGRPALKGRSLDELLKQLPPDRIWRAGENQVTTLTTEGPISVGGTTVPAGKYSVYVHAGEGNAWALVLNKDPGVPLGKIWDKAPDNMKNEPWPNLAGGYKGIEASEVARAKMTAAKAAAPADVFTITLTPAGQGVDLAMAWGAQAWTVALQPAK